jgi:hypothetical protein
MKLWFPLDALLISPKAADDDGTWYGLKKHLSCHPAIRTFGAQNNINKAWEIINKRKTNTIFFDPSIDGKFWGGNIGFFISKVKEEGLNIVFVIYTTKESRDKFVKKYPCHKSIYFLEQIWSFRTDKKLMHKKEVNAELSKCDLYHKSAYAYDIAISYAGEDWETANEIFSYLNKNKIKVYFSRDNIANSWGKDLTELLPEIFKKNARHCLLIVSNNYKIKQWTNFEKDEALKAITKKGTDYILVLKIDDIELSGFSKNIAYIKYNNKVVETSNTIIQKLFLDGTQPKLLMTESVK